MPASENAPIFENDTENPDLSHEDEFTAGVPSVLIDATEKLPPSSPLVALTFDDGPSEHTSRILDILQQYSGRVTFFVQGNLIEQNKTKINRALYMGCEVISHAWDHPDLTELPKKEIKKQLVQTAAALKSVTGMSLPMFRPPYGYVNDLVKQVAKKLGLAMIIWTLDPRDWEVRDADIVYDLVMKDVKDGDIVLCHDVYESTAEAMSRIIPELIQKGYRLVTVSDLLRRKYGKLIPGELYHN